MLSFYSLKKKDSQRLSCNRQSKKLKFSAEWSFTTFFFFFHTAYLEVAGMLLQHTATRIGNLQISLLLNLQFSE